MTQILNLKGLNDHNEVILTPGPRGQPRLGLGRGCVSILDRIGIEKSLCKQFLMFGNRVRQPAYRIPKDAVLVFNEISDADSHHIALKRAEKFCERAALPVINAPETVLNITPDKLPDLLQDLPGVQVPRIIRFQPESPRDVFHRAEEAGFSFPYQVQQTNQRPVGYVTMVQGTDDERLLHTCPLGKEDFYLAEVVERRSEAGAYPDQRIFFIGGEPLGLLDNEMLQAIHPVLLEISKRIGLDYFGLHCDISPQGQVLVLDISASMDVFHYLPPEQNLLLDEARSRFRGLLRQKSGRDLA